MGCREGDEPMAKTLQVSCVQLHWEEMITSVLDLARADRSYVLDSMTNPPFLAKYWQQMVEEMKTRKDLKPA
jgi:hypothetical protein